MQPVDTSQRLTIFPQPIGVKLVATAIGIVLLGMAGVWLGLVEDNMFMAGMSAGLIILGIWMTRVFLAKRRTGNPDATMMLSPEGLHLMTGTTGLIPWGAVNGLSSHSTRHMRGLVVNVDQAAFDALEQGKVFRAARKFDAAIGVHALIFYQQQVEVPLHDLADMLHDYSVAHGGPPLQPNRTN